ncbi:MAG: ABC transporter permease [Thermomicrobiales bacterium]
MTASVAQIEDAAAPTGAAPGLLRGLGMLAPPVLWMLIFYLIPLVILLVHAFWSVEYLTVTRDFTLENFETIVTNSLYRTVLLRTIAIATIVTLVDVILAFPIAYFIARKVTRHQQLLLMLVIFPLWSSYLVRAFAWRTILGTNGVLNTFLESVGIINEPLSFLLFSKTAMVITFAQVWLPFMILPLYTVLAQIPGSLLEASADLGSGAWSTFRRVIFPLALPGVVAGSLSVFSLTMGDYITPTLLGGPGDQMIGRIIADNFGTANNWPLGAALVAPVLVVIFTLLMVANRFGALGRSSI